MCEEGGCGACSVIEMINTGSGTGSRAISACLVPLAQESSKVILIFDWLPKRGNFEIVKVRWQNLHHNQGCWKLQNGQATLRNIRK